MAGSSFSNSPKDSTLRARIEGLKFLAHHLQEPVVVFNPEMKLVYANPSAERIAGHCPLLRTLALDGVSSDSGEITQCTSCPGPNLFQEKLGMPEELGDDSLPQLYSSCPLPRAMPLRGEDGRVHFAVMLGATARESVVWDSSDFPHSETGHDLRSDAPLDEDNALIGESIQIQRLVDLMKLVAASDSTVLIQGESGTGKELVAKTIHRWSRRRAHPFIVVECSSLPETLLESELFGHVRGAFTGAVVDRKGLFEEAEGGTIFLDEIADTSPAFQARLLRVLQEGEIKPVGSNRSIKVKVRVISAGNKPLEELVKAKKFRADLYYRLAVLPLTVPTLRERKEDIPLLVKHFLTHSMQQHRQVPLTVNPEAMRALDQYSWPGNVRELENLIERAVVTCQNATIQVKDFFGKLEMPRTDGDLSSVSKAARQAAERDRILQALTETQGDKTRAARLLKISRSNLYNKLRTYQLL